MGDQYTIRAFDDGDVDGFLSLFETIWNRRSREWFDWKYRENPYVDHVPIVVAEESSGEIVGARPFFAIDMRIGDTVHTCLQPGDTMVHPDHRRQGLFTRMTEDAIERYEGTEVRMFFNFPNFRSRPGYEKLGWRLVSKRPTYYRIENANYFANAESIPVRAGVRLANGIVGGGYELLDRVADRWVDPAVSVTATDGDPAALARFHDRHRPDECHAIRDAEFYEWRFANPDWEYRTYLGYRESDLAGALVVGSRTTPDGFVVTSILEVLPLEESAADRAVLLSLLERAVADHPETDLFKLPSDPVPSRVARVRGFLGDDQLPLSKVASLTNHVVRSVGDGWRIGASSIDDPRNWRMTFVEEDTG